MLIAVVFGLLAVADTLPVLDQFEAWRQTHGKVYDNPMEEMKRMEIFEKNAKYVEEFNSRKGRTMTLELNRFADLTDEEFLSTMTGSIDTAKDHQAWLETYTGTYEPSADFEVPDSISWMELGAVTPAKNQGSCGDCYAFAATGAIEGQWFRKTSSLRSLSEQQILDCSAGFVNIGCDGGRAETSFKYVNKAGGIESEEAYPYTAVQGECKFKLWKISAVVSGHNKVPPSEDVLQRAVAEIGPIAIAIDATLLSFRFYKSGIYSDDRCSSTDLNHAVLVFGYGTSHGDYGRDYWNVKNSWGPDWGDHGMVSIERNNGNMCGVATMPSYPIV